MTTATFTLMQAINKETQLKLNKQPNLDNEILFESKKNPQTKVCSVLLHLKKEQPNPNGSDCYLLAKRPLSNPNPKIYVGSRCIRILLNIK